jgi:hypothetical protein
MKKKVWRAKHKQDSEVILNKLADELVKEIVEEAKPKKRASKKKEA